MGNVLIPNKSECCHTGTHHMASALLLFFQTFKLNNIHIRYIQMFNESVSHHQLAKS